MKSANFPPGWDEERVQRILQHYEQLTEEEAIAEDEAAYEDSTQVVMEELRDRGLVVSTARGPLTRWRRVEGAR